MVGGDRGYLALTMVLVITSQEIVSLGTYFVFDSKEKVKLEI